MICCEKELYTIDPEGVKDRRIEAKFLNQVDGDAIGAIRLFEERTALDREWMESFAVFMALSITRNPAQREMHTRTHKAVQDDYLRIGFSEVGRAKHLLAGC